MAHSATDDARRIRDIVELLRPAKSLLFVTGAGLSADSGLPTYRGIGGLYNGDDAESGMPIEELLSGRQFRADPARTWKYLAEIGKAGRGKTPNRGHQVIAEMEKHFPRVWVLTQKAAPRATRAGKQQPKVAWYCGSWTPLKLQAPLQETLPLPRARPQLWQTKRPTPAPAAQERPAPQ